MDPTKVEAIMEFPTSTNFHELNIFMGLVGYYPQFVEVFSRIENLITEL
jgi:hypothetical protein